MVISTTWATIKTKSSDNSWTKHYIDFSNDEDSSRYIIMVGDVTIQYYTKIVTTELTEFETTFKSASVEIFSFNEGLEKVTASLTSEALDEDNAVDLRENFLRKSKLFHVNDQQSFSSTSLHDKMLIRNPVGSTVNLLILKLDIGLTLGALTNQMNTIKVRVRRNPVFSSNGSALVAYNLKFDEAGPAHALIFENPTPSNTGNTVQRLIGINSEHVKAVPFIIKPGEDVLVSERVNDPDNGAYINLTFAEDTI